MAEDVPQPRPAEPVTEGPLALWTPPDDPWLPPDDAYTWERVPADGATASAIVEDLAGAFELEPVTEGHWRLNPRVGRSFYASVAVRRDDAASASVGLYFHEDVDEHLGCGLALLCLLLGGMLWLGAWIVVGELSPLTVLALSPVWFMLPAVVMFRVVQALRRRRIRRAIDGWRRRFTPALAARCAPFPPYR